MGKIKFLNKRSLKYGSNSIILIVAVVAIAVIINLLVGMGDFRMDLTVDKIYSISEESKAVVKEIDKEVEITGLFDDGQVPVEYKQLINLLNEYESLGVKVSYIDPDKNPGKINELDPDKTKGIAKGDFIVQSGKKIKKLTAYELYGQESQYGRLYSGEKLITGAIKYVTAEVTPVVYFVEGHSEFTIDSDLTQIKTVFENNNLEVKTLSLLSEPKIPDDCNILMFASPKKDLSEDERIKVEAYLKKNGNVVFLFDSLESNDKFPNFEEVLATYNVGINYDKVKELDENRHLPGDEFAILSTVENNEINSSFSSSTYPVFFMDSRSIEILKNAKEWITTTSLVKTTDKAVASNIIGEGEGQGPFNLAVASEISGGSKVLVFGNAVFLTDRALSSQYGQYFANGANYFLTTVINWMQGKQDESPVSSKLITQKSLSTTASQTKVISIALIGVLPLLIMGCGFVVWTRRRHL